MDGKATKWTRIDDQAKLDIDRRILAIAEYVVNPLLANFASKCPYRQQFQVSSPLRSPFSSSGSSSCR